MIPGEAQQLPLEKEYAKGTGITPEDIKKLREWTNNQPHLPSQYITDLDLILAYHCCERSTAVTKQVIDLHYTLKTLFNIFKDRTIADGRIERALNTTLFQPLPMRSRDGYACMYCRIVDTNTKNFVYADAVKIALMILDLWQYEEGTWPGYMFVVDLQTMSAGHLACLEIQVIQQFFYFVQEALLVKLKGMHFMNAPSFMDKLMMLIKPFLKKELLDKLHIHQPGSMDLDKFISMEALPKDAGGNYKSVDECREDISRKILANKSFFEAESLKRVCESRRPGKPKTVTDFFGGVEGSFKKLDID